MKLADGLVAGVAIVRLPQFVDLFGQLHQPIDLPAGHVFRRQSYGAAFDLLAQFIALKHFNRILVFDKRHDAASPVAAILQNAFGFQAKERLPHGASAHAGPIGRSGFP